MCVDFTRWHYLACQTAVTTIVFLSLVPGPLGAENWNAWRGPRGDGISMETGLPQRWSDQENVAWKISVPGTGHASPIVWDDRIFLVTCNEQQQERILLCLDRHSGKTNWQQVVLRATLETKHPLNSYASSTPATDGKFVYVSFLEADGDLVPALNVGTERMVSSGKMVVAAYDLDGRQQWLVRPGNFASVHGFCSCPVIYKNLLIVNGDHDGDSYIVALERSTGRTIWKIPREHKTRSFVTPIIREVGGRTQMMMSGSLSVTSYEPKTGKLLWFIDGPTEQFVASPVYAGELLFLTAGFPEHHILAIDPTGSGDVTDSRIVWRTTKGAGYVPSPIAVDKFLLVATDEGVISCFVAATGQRLWRKRIGEHYSTSAVTAGGLAYFLADDGVTTVIKPDHELEIVARNALNERCYSSPAISHGQFLIRGEKHLYCIGKEG